MPSPLVVLGLSALAVILAGTRLARYADEVGERYHLGGAVVGIVILALVTSLPELVIGVISSTVASADFAVGNAMGSNLYNLTILAIADGFHRTGTLLSCVSRRLLLSCVLSQLLVAAATLAILVKPNVAVGWVGVDSLVLFVAYLGCLGMIARAQRVEEAAIDAAAAGASDAMASWMAAVPARAAGTPPRLEASTEAGPSDLHPSSMAVRLNERPLKSLSTLALWSRMGLYSALILAAGPFLVHACEHLAKHSGLGATFVGSVILAIVGSLPELVVSIEAVRIGAYDMAVGNVLGSNMFNMVLLFVSDLFYTRGPLLSHASSQHAVTGLFVLLLTSVVMTGLIYRSRRSIAGFGVDSILVLVGYCLALVTLLLRPHM